VGRIVAAFSLLMLLPLAFALATGDGAERAFGAGFGLTLVAGLALGLAARRFRRELQPRDGFLLVGLTWVSLPLFGALPRAWLVLGLAALAPALLAADASPLGLGIALGGIQMRFELPGFLGQRVEAGDEGLLFGERRERNLLGKKPIFLDANPIGRSLARGFAKRNERG